LTTLLGIETSCDETAAAVVVDRCDVRSSIVASQIDLHRAFGGVVPEIAARRHVEAIGTVIDEALEVARVDWDALDGLAVTRGPGLIGSLLVGLSAAKAAAWQRGLPLLAVHHLEGHIRSAFLEHPAIPFPAIALVVSGGHTSLYLCAEEDSYRLMARTRDDAAGEAFDKVAKLLGLGYPGGPVIDRLSDGADEQAFDFPKAQMKDRSLDFSFSGIKTAVRLEAERLRLDSAGRAGVLESDDGEPIDGLVIANEVLDALPTHRVVIRDGLLREILVDLGPEGGLVDVEAPPTTPLLARRLGDEGIDLAEGQHAEICLALDSWVAEAAAGLRRGAVLLIDYGYPAGELYDPRRRAAGTLAAYLRHQVHDDPYRAVGRQDLTAHVDVTAVERATVAAGLDHLGTTTQSAFLDGLGAGEILVGYQTGPDATLQDYLTARAALVRMIDPAAMGRFRVMAFGRGLPVGTLLRGLPAG